VGLKCFLNVFRSECLVGRTEGDQLAIDKYYLIKQLSDGSQVVVGNDEQIAGIGQATNGATENVLCRLIEA
jgi:hypothetical protein